MIKSFIKKHWLHIILIIIIFDLYLKVDYLLKQVSTLRTYTTALVKNANKINDDLYDAQSQAAEAQEQAEQAQHEARKARQAAEEVQYYQP